MNQWINESMNRWPLLLVVIAFSCFGCSSSYVYEADGSRQSDKRIPHVENLLRAGTEGVQIQLLDGGKSNGDVTRVTSDSVFVKHSVLETTTGFPLRNVRSIRRSNAHVATGILVGAAVGVIAGYALARSNPNYSDHGNTNWPEYDYLPYMALATPFFSFIGGIIGGYIEPATVTYIRDGNSESATKEILAALREPALERMTLDSGAVCLRLLYVDPLAPPLCVRVTIGRDGTGTAIVKHGSDDTTKLYRATGLLSKTDTLSLGANELLRLRQNATSSAFFSGDDIPQKSSATPCTIIERNSTGTYRIIAKDEPSSDEFTSLRKYFFELGRLGR